MDKATTSNEQTTLEIRAQTLNALRQILPTFPTKPLTTNQLAESLGVQPETVRRGLSVNGHYGGLVPIKLPNRRLLWPIAQ